VHCTDLDKNCKIIDEMYTNLVESLLGAAAVSVPTKKYNTSRKH